MIAESIGNLLRYTSLKRREIIREVSGADSLTQSLIDALIDKVYVFPGNRIEIVYKMQDVFNTGEKPNK